MPETKNVLKKIKTKKERKNHEIMEAQLKLGKRIQ